MKTSSAKNQVVRGTFYENKLVNNKLSGCDQRANYDLGMMNQLKLVFFLVHTDFDRTCYDSMAPKYLGNEFDLLTCEFCRFYPISQSSVLLH